MPRAHRTSIRRCARILGGVVAAEVMRLRSAPGKRRDIGGPVRGKSGQAVGPLEIAGALGNCAIFRISLTVRRCALSPRARLTADLLFRHAVGGGMRLRLRQSD